MTAYEKRIHYLLDRFADDKATEPEIHEMIDLLQAAGDNPELESFLVELSNYTKTDQTAMPDRERLWQQVQYRNNLVAPVRRITWRRMAAAATILLLAGVGSYLLFLPKPGNQTEMVKTSLSNDIKAPESNRAAITLANGTKVYLDNAANGALAKQGSVQIMKNEDGKITYSGTAKEFVYNTLTNPKGSKVIDMTLADGSRVWLNAGSSVIYPVAFTGNGRKVTITGEAYFEIAHDKERPFTVSKGDMSIQVLGTKFNVNAYDDESDIKVTLLQGSVKISRLTESKILEPGEQIIATGHSPFTINHSPDLEQIMAWQRGLFEFNNTELPVIMRQISRWYDVEIKYSEQSGRRKFGGGISRNLPLSEVLQLLEANGGLEFRLEGKTLIIE